jgi:GNAT superfamily N-acetyltransferase
MSEEITIRIAAPEDAGALIEFNQAMALETEGKRLEPEKIGQGVRAVFRDEKKGFYVVAENDAGNIIGGLMITYEWSDWRNGWFWWIQSVYILPEGRGKKIYTRLYDFVKAKAEEERDVCGFRLYVDIENKHAQKVYEAVGMHASHYLMFGEEV